jgi:protein-serine/threonine kinase
MYDTDSSADPHTGSNGSREKLSVLPTHTPLEPVYGDRSKDQGDEVRFYVELTRIEGLDGTYSLDIRRLKGHLTSYKFLYDTIRG